MSHEGGPESTQQRTVAELLAKYGGDTGERAPRRRRRRPDEITDTAPQAIIERVNSESAKLAPIRDDQSSPRRTSHRQQRSGYHQAPPPADPRPADPRPADPRPADPRPADPRPADPRPARSAEARPARPAGPLPVRQPQPPPPQPPRPVPSPQPPRPGLPPPEPQQLPAITQAEPTTPVQPPRTRRVVPPQPGQSSGPFTRPPAPEPGPYASGYLPPPGQVNGTHSEDVTEQLPKIGPPGGRTGAHPLPFSPARSAFDTTMLPPAGPESRPGELQPDGYPELDLEDYPDEDGLDEYDDEEPEENPSPGREWLVMAGQVAVSVVGGAAVWLGFNWLWSRLPQAALVAALAVIVGLVWIVRKIRRADDLQTTGLAVLVGLFVTVSPAALLLLSR